MRCFSMLFTAVLLAPALASAEPALGASASEPAAPVTAPKYDVQVSALGGAQLFGPYYDGFAIEGGNHLGGPFWSHGEIGAGEATITHSVWVDANSERGQFWTARGGLEMRGYLPGTHDMIGGFLGGDVGARAFTTEMTTDTKPLALARVGLDLGVSHVRARGSLALATEGYVEATAGLGYQW
jgi:hypothetical protein